MIITLDGPAASGKSTAARLLAQQMGYAHLNTGLIYRACAFVLIRDYHCLPETIAHQSAEVINGIVDDLIYTYLPESGGHMSYKSNDITDFLRPGVIGDLASRVSVSPIVRDAVNRLQRSFAQHENVVAEGRDCGSVLFPNATYKFYITASPHARAERWLLDQKKLGKDMSFDEALKAIHLRDERDTTRTVAPLIIPVRATIIDSSHLSIDQLVTTLIHVIQSENS